MSAKRRDNRNRILRGGESQRKDGRYMYKYIDNAGNAKYVYSWKLVKTDTVPQWLLFIGKSISSIYVKSTTRFTKKNYQRLHLMYAGIPFVPTWRNRE